MKEKNIFDFPDLGSYLLVLNTIKSNGPIALDELIKKLKGRVNKSHVVTIVDYMLTKNELRSDENRKMIL